MSRLVAHAMIDDDGQVFFPDSPDDARLFHELHGARPADPARFPWPCAATRLDCEHRGWVETQCSLVEGHRGDHEAVVKWP